ncbi:MAG: hypothetical protein M1436_02165 [Acidobacteria bacterium]|nr:hypothetical protein [Acidobacteriota bacterium]
MPAPTANVVAGHRKEAFSDLHGVKVTANGDAWHGDPADLEYIFTPIEVHITNNSEHPLRLSYRDFQLSTSNGFRSYVLPPYKLTGSVTKYESVSPGFYSNRFLLAPYYAGYYPGFGVWSGPFAWDWGYYPAYYVWQQSLPTGDMVSKAVPEGVLDDGGRITGFLYFQKVPKGVASATLSFDLVDANTGRKLTTIHIPFTVKH